MPSIPRLVALSLCAGGFATAAPLHADGAHAQPAPGPTRSVRELAIGHVDVVGRYDRKNVQRGIHSQRAAMLACYDHALARDASTSGLMKIALEFDDTIPGYVDGFPERVAITRSVVGDAYLETCVADVFDWTEFVHPKSGGVASVRFSIWLKPPLPIPSGIQPPPGPPDPVPRLVRRSPSCEGALPVTTVQRALQRQRPAIVACYATALESDPDLAGTLTLTWTVGPRGVRATRTVSDGLRRRGLTRCISAAVARLDLVAPAGERSRSVVTYPFELVAQPVAAPR